MVMPQQQNALQILHVFPLWKIFYELVASILFDNSSKHASSDIFEREALVAFAVKKAAGRVPVVIGTGGNNTEHAIRSSRAAKALGADAVLVVTPYYNKPSQEKLFRHFKTVAEAAEVPMILYNVPGRTYSDRKSRVGKECRSRWSPYH